ncbi:MULTISPECIES: UvrD-helicase domain-containing protein [unclassified Cupriavidus]|uniref:UvrD-helicase domain-containing protein n=1 Tax=unclassified Cupriavidus TaxID=2640874 RepID=UPI0010F8AE37|nr:MULTISPECIES: UvrD-helicase domain-containing protein [unclassified Cupriavidus]MCA3188587.1 UvrD-helicase domain-containing protein [Cupriavidus sp.]QWE98019.1 UvrD-helicase domain-containing protein [Cupriavidus sp. EM10]
MSKATHEQLTAINSAVRRLVVQACPGAGKTFTLREYALVRPSERILYLTYTKSLQTEAEGKFPQNVECRTTHSLAWSFGRRFKDAGKLGDLRPSDFARAFGIEIGFASILVTTVTSFLFSADTDFEPHHVPDTIAEADVAETLKWGRLAWEAMRDLGRKNVPMPHDGYLKLFQLSKPDLSRRYDRILFDEGQDANPVTTSIVLAQNCPVVIVGDRYQAIFAFRGAVNAMDMIQPDETVYLTQSHRFGPGIARLATMLLSAFRGEERPVHSAFPDRPTGYTVDVSKPYAVIGRTNAKLFDKAVAMLGNKRLHFVGGLSNYPFDKLVDVWSLMSGQPAAVKDQLLKTFGSLEKLEEYATGVDDKEILSLIGVVKEYRSAIPSLVERIKAEAVEQAEHADVLLSTAHRAKGLEFSQVLLLDDFEDFVTANGELLTLDTPELVQELHLLFVALTRAEDVIELNAQMQDIIAILGDRVPEAQPTPGERSTEQVGEQLGQIPGFDYVPVVYTCDVAENATREQDAPMVALAQVPVGAGTDIEKSVELAILRQGLLHVPRLAQEVGVSREIMADVIVEMIRKGLLAESLFLGSPEVVSRLRVAVAA